MVAALIPRRTGCVARVSACTATYLQRTEAVSESLCMGMCICECMCTSVRVMCENILLAMSSGWRHVVPQR